MPNGHDTFRDANVSAARVLARSQPRRRRTRGTIDELPSGALCVRVYAGADPLTGKRHDLVEVIPPDLKAAALAEATRVWMLAQVDECSTSSSTAIWRRSMSPDHPRDVAKYLESTCGSSSGG